MLQCVNISAWDQSCNGPPGITVSAKWSTTYAKNNPNISQKIITKERYRSMLADAGDSRSHTVKLYTVQLTNSPFNTRY